MTSCKLLLLISYCSVVYSQNSADSLFLNNADNSVLINQQIHEGIPGDYPVDIPLPIIAKVKEYIQTPFGTIVKFTFENINAPMPHAQFEYKDVDPKDSIYEDFKRNIEANGYENRVNFRGLEKFGIFLYGARVTVKCVWDSIFVCIHSTAL